MKWKQNKAAAAGASNTFSGSLSAFARKTRSSLSEAHRAIVIELFGSIIADTPVDEGRARGNWQTNVGGAKTGVLERLDATGPVGSNTARTNGGSIAEMVSNTGDAGDKVYMANNLPYAEPLEFGHSQTQAPAGMVRKNYARVHNIVAKAAREVRSKTK